MANADATMPLDPSRLNDIIRDLNYYSRLFKSQNKCMAGGVLTRKNLVDAETIVNVIQRHRPVLRDISSSIHENLIIAVQHESRIDTEKNEEGDLSDNTDDEECASVLSPSSDLLAGCKTPDTLADVTPILLTFDIRIRNLETLSTLEFESCESMLSSCQKCIDEYKDRCAAALESEADLITVMREYSTKVVMTMKEIVRNKGKGQRSSAPTDLNLVLKINKCLRDSLEELKVFMNETSKLNDELRDLSKELEEKNNKATELWMNGEAETYTYFNNDTLSVSTHRDILCWVRADRKTMKKRMLKCVLTQPDQMSYKIGDSEVLLSWPVTLSSTTGEILKAHETKIGIFIPYQPVPTNDKKDIVVLTTSGQSNLHEVAKYTKVTHRGKPCLLVEVDHISFLSVLVVFRPALYEVTVGVDGATVEPPTDQTVKIDIPPAAVSKNVLVGVQSIPKDDLPIARVQTFRSDLGAASSMVYPKLPKEMTKPAKVRMNVDNPSEDSNLIHGVVCSDEGWSVEQVERSLTDLESFNINITPETKQVIVINTTKQVASEEIKKVAEAIVQAINEEKVNCLVLQNLADPRRLYVECCKAEYTPRRLETMERKNFTPVASFQDIYLKEGAMVTISCTNDIVFDLPRDKTEIQLHFSSELSRPNEVYIKPRDARHSVLARGYVEFAAGKEDVGISEIELRRFDQGTEDIFVLCNIPVTLKIQEEETQTKVDDYKLVNREEGMVNTNVRETLDDLLMATQRVDDLLTMDDLVKLTKILNLRKSATSIRKSKQARSSLADLMSSWLKSTLVSRDKLPQLADALRKIKKPTAAEIVHRISRKGKNDILFVDVVRYLANDGNVLKDTKMLLLCLGLEEADWVELESQHQRSLKDMLISGLLLWKSRLGEKATFDLLIQKLEEGKHIRAAEWLREHTAPNSDND